jgi:ATPase subunit of ABC transporter with duplicated ATPase domains
VLDHVTPTVSPGDRVGVVWPNGIGKSTLLRILAGLESPDTGSVVRAGTAGYLPQEPDARPGETVLGSVARRTGIAAAAADIDELAARLHDEPGEDFESRACAALAGVGLAGRDGQQQGSLSGGEAARVSRAAVLLARFDFFLLDEPTNNLDFAGLERIERFLDGLPAGVVLVSHDRDFLDRTVTRVVELEAETRRVGEYAGTWSDYEGARDRARNEHERAYAG